MMTTPNEHTSDSTLSLVDDIVAWDQGDLDHDATVTLFQHLIDSGQAWRLQGSVGRTAHDLITAGYCTLGPSGCNDAYGNYVPGRDELKPGSPGTIEYVDARRGDE